PAAGGQQGPAPRRAARVLFDPSPSESRRLEGPRLETVRPRADRRAPRVRHGDARAASRHVGRPRPESHRTDRPRDVEAIQSGGRTLDGVPSDPDPLTRRAEKRFMDILRAIGNTSLVRLRKVVPPDCAEILVKLEWENPTGSMK